MHGGRSVAGPWPGSKEGDSQRSSTSVNESQTRQRDIGGVVELPAPTFVEMRLIRMCRDELDAMNLCIDLSQLADEVLCEKLGIDKGHWCRMRKGRAHFPTAKRLAAMQLCGNWAPLQFEMWKARILDRLQELRAPRDDGFAAFAGAA